MTDQHPTRSKRPCACGCPLTVTRDQRALYASDLCKARARARRRRVSRLTAIETGLVTLPRMKPSAKKVICALLAVGNVGCTTRELCQPTVGGSRFGGRIFELREMGFRIDATRLSDNSSRYVLRESAMSERLFDVTPQREAA